MLNALILLIDDVHHKTLYSRARTVKVMRSIVIMVDLFHLAVTFKAQTTGNSLRFL